MTGLISLAVPAVAYSMGADEKELWWGLAYAFLLISAFRVWELEYGKPGPQISMEYQTPNQTAVNETNFTDWKRWEAVDGGREIPFTLRNESEIAAYNVQVGNISLAGNTATFEPVPMVVKGEPRQVSVTIEELGAMQLHDFREFLSRGWQSSDPLLIPVVVSYTDIQGRQYESHSEISYDRWVIRTSHKKYVRVHRKPKWLIRNSK